MLEYNGVDWSLFKLPNKTIVRSICLSGSGQIYVGGQDEVGYFESNDVGVLEYHSIRSFIPESFLPLEDVWEIIALKNDIYFRSTNRVYHYQENTKEVQVYDPQEIIISIDIINEKAYYTDLVNGIVAIETNNPLPGLSQRLKNLPKTSLVDIQNGKIIILTENSEGYFYENGQIFPLPEPLNTLLIKNNVNHAVYIGNKLIAIGTKFNGVYIINQDGEVLSNFNKSNGLQNNTVNRISLDNEKNLWVSTTNGIDKIRFNDNIKLIYPDSELEGACYAVMKHENKLYFGLNTGLYYCDIDHIKSDFKTNFKKVKNSEGQVWGLDTINGDLFMGHNRGGYVIKNNVALRFTTTEGAWKFLETKKNDIIYVGGYNGVSIYKKINGQYQYVKDINDFTESSRIMIAPNENELWISHPYRGIYKILHSDDFNTQSIKLYSEKDGLPSKLNNYIFNIRNTPYITSENGIYKYDSINDKFLKDNTFSYEIENTSSIARLYENNDGDIYYASNAGSGRISEIKPQKYVKQEFPELKNVLLGGFEILYIFDKKYLIAGSDKGAIIYDQTYTIPDTTFSSIIHGVNLISANDSLLYGGYSAPQRTISLSAHQNAFRFEFGSSIHNLGNKYQYRLLGYSREWSQWQGENSKEFNNLKSGDYDFQVRAQNPKLGISQISSFEFKIQAPWYETSFAYLFYSLLILTSIGLLYFIPSTKYKKVTSDLKIANIQTQEELELVKNEKLRDEIKHQNAELASATMHLVQKNETINKIRSNIDQVRKKIKDPEAKKELKKIISTLSDDERLENDWESFSYHFDQVHSDFLKRLKGSFPNLSTKDLKLSAYLRMNLTTKEIAPLLGISVRGVEISRYRLRKKMELDTKTNLTKFMLEF